MEKFKILKKMISKNYCYYILSLNEKKYFAKQLISDDEDLKLQLKNEIGIYNNLKKYDFLPQIIMYEDVKEFYIVYDYINGTRIDEEKNNKEILNYLLELTDILIKLHSNNIIHCDIKPSNILICDNKVKLIDYGNSRFINEVTEYGSRRYCSVEQLRKKNITEWFDIYSFGIVMYELLYHIRPYENMELKDILTLKSTKDLFEVSNNVNLNPLQKIINKATSCNIENRYKNMIELKKDLLEYINSNLVNNLVSKGDVL